MSDHHVWRPSDLLVTNGSLAPDSKVGLLVGGSPGAGLKGWGLMQKTKLKPDGSTYGAMLDACVRNGEKSLALKMYRRALDAGITHNQHIYTGTIAACIPDRDKDTALRIFNEMLRCVAHLYTKLSLCSCAS
jgi:pentatricopeptide repeat protein